MRTFEVRNYLPNQIYPSFVPWDGESKYVCPTAGQCAAISHTDLVPDWNYETSMDPALIEANESYIAVSLFEFTELMGRGIMRWSQEAAAFRELLLKGSLPNLDVSL